jgi:hypothetical protein
VDVITTLTAVRLGVLETEEAQLGGALEELARELTLVLPLALERHDLLANPAVDRLPQVLVLLLERRQVAALAGVLDHRHT